MVRKYLFLASVAAGLTAVAAPTDVAQQPAAVFGNQLKVSDFVKSAKAQINDGSVANRPAKVASTAVQWKRPAGQFWGTGYLPDVNAGFFYFTPLQLRPWVDYTFENISTATGTGIWTIQNWSNATAQYKDSTSRETNVTASYLLYERANTPRLQYRGQVIYPTQFSGAEETYNEEKGIGYLAVNPNVDCIINTADYGMQKMALSSHYWSAFTRNETDGGGLIRYTGATGYPEMEDPESDGLWFGTNARGINAMATRFEKPDRPYLLNGVVWYYIYNMDIPVEVPLKAYVFKTANDAKVETFTSSTTGQEVSIETLEVGELIAEAEGVVPVTVNPEGKIENGCVQFRFMKKNPVTGAENAYSLEIDDDITIIVTGFNANLGNGGWISSLLSLDEFDEGYGNLGFLGSFDMTEDGTIEYSMNALKDFFSSPLPNTTLGVLADVSYPWILGAYNYPDVIALPNDGQTTEAAQGLQVALQFASSAMTDDYEITYNGEEECDWFELIGVDDEMETTEDGEEEFTGYTWLEFEAAPNPEDIKRTVEVKITIPAASYTISFTQGSKEDTAVEIVGVESTSSYYDLAGRRVANPEKGIYIRKAGNKTEKVIL